MKMDILKMSKIENPKKVLKKLRRSRFVMIMLSFIKKSEKKHDDNFFEFFLIKLSLTIFWKLLVTFFGYFKTFYLFIRF
jgi:hypothetical protein